MGIVTDQFAGENLKELKGGEILRSLGRVAIQWGVTPGVGEILKETKSTLLFGSRKLMASGFADDPWKEKGIVEELRFRNPIQQTIEQVAGGDGSR